MRKNTRTARQICMRYVIMASISAGILLQGCSSYDGPPRFKEAEEVEVKESTKGVMVQLEEVDPGDDYKITNEEMLEDKSKSIAVVKYLDGHTDTLSLKKMKEGGYHGMSSPLRTVLFASMASSFFNRGMGSSSAMNASAYKTPEAFSKSQSMHSEMQKSAVTRKMSMPGKASRGYGSGKSFRSFGG